MLLSQVISSDDLLTNCLDNISRYLNKKPSNTNQCLELLRRAFGHQRGDDWDKAYIILVKVTGIFVRSHKLAYLIPNTDDFVTASISRFWASVHHRYERFDTTEHFFSFLKMCVNSEIVDYIRKASRESAVEPPPPGDFGDCTVDEIMDIIQQEIGDDDRMILLADLFFRWGMKARHIVKNYPHIFPEKREVYTLIYTLRQQLRQNPDLLECLRNS